MLGARDLILCSGSLPHAGFEEMVRVASRAGFEGITVWPRDYRGALESGLEPADLRALLADHGIAVADLDPLLTWLPPSVGGWVDPGPYADATERDFFEMAEVLSAQSVNVAQGFGDWLDLDGAAEAFAGLCDRAWEFGLLVTVEFLPWSGIPDVSTAYDLVSRAGRPNGRVLVDVWHFFRGPSTLDQLAALPASAVGSVQLDDAPAEPAPDLVVETMEARLIPGEGDAPVLEILRTLDRMGADAPIGVEVFSKALQARPAQEVADELARAARDVIAKAREG